MAHQFGPPTARSWSNDGSLINLNLPRPIQSRSSITLYTNAVYYPNWRVYRGEPPSTLKPSTTSIIFYAFASIQADGTVYLSDEWADTQIEVDGTQGCLQAVKQLKLQNNHLKVVLSVGGGGHGRNIFARVAANVQARDRFGQSAKTLIDLYQFDGIDVDWEHPTTPEEGHNYVHLLHALRYYLPSPRYMLTSALPAGEWCLRNINLAIASCLLDFINLMGYDFAGPWSEVSGHHAQLYGGPQSVSSGIIYALSRGVTSRKILLGIPAYGRSFLGASGAGQRFTGHAGDEGTFDYKELPLRGTQEQVDMQAGVTFCVGETGGFISYDNPQTVRMKADFVRQMNLGGLFYWPGPGDAEGSRSLVDTGFSALHGF